MRVSGGSLALLIILRASVSFKPRKVVMFSKQFFHLKILV